MNRENEDRSVPSEPDTVPQDLVALAKRDTMVIATSDGITSMYLSKTLNVVLLENSPCQLVLEP
jgi:tRNA(Leu) C34 or U34 (ribose-2'-O)-methylase TrmL